VGRNDTLLPLNEIKCTDPKRVQKMAYSPANCQGKGTMTREHDGRAKLGWRRQTSSSWRSMPTSWCVETATRRQPITAWLSPTGTPATRTPLWRRTSDAQPHHPFVQHCFEAGHQRRHTDHRYSEAGIWHLMPFLVVKTLPGTANADVYGEPPPNGGPLLYSTGSKASPRCATKGNGC